LSRLRVVLGGDTRLLLVSGDAGVGKTRFVREGLGRAAADGLVAVWGAGMPLAGRLPLLPVAAALGELGRVEGGGLLEAALGAAPGYVRGEAGRLLPELGAAPAAVGGQDEGWQRERLFSGLAELLWAAARRSALALVIDDVQWADSESLDFLTVLARAVRADPVTVVAVCRSDEAPLDAHVAGWLAQVRGAAGVEEIRLGPLSRGEVAEQVAWLAGGPAPDRVVEVMYARAEGNPFYTEQLVAAAPAGPGGEALGLPAGLPARLAELLAARVAGCAGDARAVLSALAVAGRPLDEDLLCAAAGLGAEAARGGLRELAAARLLADGDADGAHRPRHALLAEAVAAGLLTGERAVLHERLARALEARGEESLAAEAAAHWAVAGRAAEERAARVAAAGAAERVFGYTEAAVHLQRAIELSRALPAARPEETVLPRLYVRAVDALEVCGDRDRALVLAEEAYHRFAGHPDPATAAAICHRTAQLRGIDAVYFGGPDAPAALALANEALRLYEQAPPSADQAMAWQNYAALLMHTEGRVEEALAAFRHALHVAEAVGAGISNILGAVALCEFSTGRVEDGIATFSRLRALAEASGEERPVLGRALHESFSLYWMGKFENAAELALRGLQAARQTGLQDSVNTGVLTALATLALLTCGRTEQAAALIDPLTTGPPSRYTWFVHISRAEVDMLRGDLEAATRRQQQMRAQLGHPSSILAAPAGAQGAAEVMLWARRPADALEEVMRVLALFKTRDLTVFCGWLVALGMRACADLAEQARARRDDPAADAAAASGAELASWAERRATAPLTDYPFFATLPAERAMWAAERTRLAGASDPAAWSAAAGAWADLGCPHRAGYAWWRHAEAHLAAGQDRPAAETALRAAVAAADGHAPLLAQIRTLAGRARIRLDPPPATPETPPAAAVPAPYGLTGRELAVLRLLASGATNAQIGAQLYISPKTASVHVTSILRKLGASSRVQAAAVAERAGLLEGAQP
jgi:DNA-binding CsgD family transcriptional regulator/tetratricopeptide (TPR) repeat protein